MNATQKAALRQVHQKVIQDLDVDDIVSYLYQENMITVEEYEELTELNETRTQKCERLLNIIQLPGSNCTFAGFIAALQYKNVYTFLAKSLQTELQETLRRKCIDSEEQGDERKEEAPRCDKLYEPVSKINVIANRKKKVAAVAYKLKRLSHEGDAVNFRKVQEAIMESFTKNKLERTKDISKRMELADMRFTALEAEASSRRVKYVKDSNWSTTDDPLKVDVLLNFFKRSVRMELTRGKRAVKASVMAQSLNKKSRISPLEDAKFWCETGLDKDGFKKQFISKTVGFGIIATKEFRQGDFLLEYVGTRISEEEAKSRNKKYASQNTKSVPRCYMYYYKYKNKQYCIDATTEVDRLARYVNDAPIKDHKCNAKMKLKVFNDYPRLCLFALKDIKAGEEILYDYGEDETLLFWRTKEKGSTAPSPVDSDDDPFDVERDQRAANLKALKKGDGLCDDVSDLTDADYMPENRDVSFEDIDGLWEDVPKDADYVTENSEISSEHNKNQSQNSDISPSRIFRLIKCH